ncbi:hypothetical protein HDU93_007778 [Gonapodya sp. JEL0774]|nr:hypothetical protein HDU93_007778 [Gonapodya sp. JEL0774]
MEVNTILDEYDANVPQGGRAPFHSPVRAFARRLALFARCPGCSRRVQNVDSLFDDADLVTKDDPLYASAARAREGNGPGRGAVGVDPRLCRECAAHGATKTETHGTSDTFDVERPRLNYWNETVFDPDAQLDERNGAVERIGPLGVVQRFGTPIDVSDMMITTLNHAFPPDSTYIYIARNLTCPLSLTILNPSSSFPSASFLLPPEPPSIASNTHLPHDVPDPALHHLRRALLKRHIAAGRTETVEAVVLVEECAGTVVPEGVKERVGGNPLPLPHLLLHISSPQHDPLFHHRVIFTPLTLPPGWLSLSSLATALRAAVRDAASGKANAILVFVEPLPPTRNGTCAGTGNTGDTTVDRADSSTTPAVLVVSHKTPLGEVVSLAVPLHPASSSEVKSAITANLKDITSQVAQRRSDVAEAMERCRKAGGGQAIVEGMGRWEATRRSADAERCAIGGQLPSFSKTVPISVLSKSAKSSLSSKPLTITIYPLPHSRPNAYTSYSLRVSDPADPFLAHECTISKETLIEAGMEQATISWNGCMEALRLVEEAVGGVGEGRSTVSVALRAKFRTLAMQLRETEGRMTCLVAAAARRPRVAAELAATMPAWAAKLVADGRDRQNEDKVPRCGKYESQDEDTQLAERSVGAQAGRPLRMPRGHGVSHPGGRAVVIERGRGCWTKIRSVSRPSAKGKLIGASAKADALPARRPQSPRKVWQWDGKAHEAPFSATATAAAATPRTIDTIEFVPVLSRLTGERNERDIGSAKAKAVSTVVTAEPRPFGRCGSALRRRVPSASSNKGGTLQNPSVSGKMISDRCNSADELGEFMGCGVAANPVLKAPLKAHNDEQGSGGDTSVGQIPSGYRKDHLHYEDLGASVDELATMDVEGTPSSVFSTLSSKEASKETNSFTTRRSAHASAMCVTNSRTPSGESPGGSKDGGSQSSGHSELRMARKGKSLTISTTNGSQALSESDVKSSFSSSERRRSNALVDNAQWDSHSSKSQFSLFNETPAWSGSSVSASSKRFSNEHEARSTSSSTASDRPRQIADYKENCGRNASKPFIRIQGSDLLSTERPPNAKERCRVEESSFGAFVNRTQFTKNLNSSDSNLQASTPRTSSKTQSSRRGSWRWDA